MIATLSSRSRLLGAALLLASASPACNFNKIAADQTASLMNDAAPALDGFFDLEIAGVGTQAAIMQLEAMHSVSPENEDLTLNLVKAYVGHAVGWVENEYEVAYAAGDMDKADRLRQRARNLYLRARTLALGCMHHRDEGIDAAIKAPSPDVLKQYVKKHYSEKSDVAPIFWAGLSWGGAINMGMDQPDLIAEAPLAKVLVERAKELDDSYLNGGAYVFLGSMESAMPPAMGGNPERGRELFEQGLAKTGRKNHVMQVNYARIYAVNTQNRELFIKLLNEVIEAPDQGNGVRLTNKVARRRAERYLRQVSELF